MGILSTTFLVLTPRPWRRLAKKPELVSTVDPLRISSPMTEKKRVNYKKSFSPTTPAVFLLTIVLRNLVENLFLSIHSNLVCLYKKRNKKKMF